MTTEHARRAKERAAVDKFLAELSDAKTQKQLLSKMEELSARPGDVREGSDEYKKKRMRVYGNITAALDGKAAATTETLGYLNTTVAFCERCALETFATSENKRAHKIWADFYRRVCDMLKKQKAAAKA